MDISSDEGNISGLQEVEKKKPKVRIIKAKKSTLSNGKVGSFEKIGESDKGKPSVQKLKKMTKDSVDDDKCSYKF